MIKVQRTKDGKLILSVQGELDHHSAPVARAEMDQALENHQFKEIVFELSGLTFMDSSGIGVLLGRYKKVQSLGAKIYVSGANTAIDKLLQMSGIYTIMPKADKEVS